MASKLHNGIVFATPPGREDALVGVKCAQGRSCRSGSEETLRPTKRKAEGTSQRKGAGEENQRKRPLPYAPIKGKVPARKLPE